MTRIGLGLYQQLVGHVITAKAATDLRRVAHRIGLIGNLCTIFCGITTENSIHIVVGSLVNQFFRTRRRNGIGLRCQDIAHFIIGISVGFPGFTINSLNQLPRFIIGIGCIIIFLNPY